MVQHDFSAPKQAVIEAAASPTAALDQFLDYQNQSYFEELYKSEAVCLCILRYVLEMNEREEGNRMRRKRSLISSLLPPVVRHIILHILWSHRPLHTTDVKALCQIPVNSPLSV